jgi:hypothetical protein
MAQHQLRGLLLVDLHADAEQVALGDPAQAVLLPGSQQVKRRNHPRQPALLIQHGHILDDFDVPVPSADCGDRLGHRAAFRQSEKLGSHPPTSALVRVREQAGHLLRLFDEFVDSSSCIDIHDSPLIPLGYQQNLQAGHYRSSSPLPLALPAFLTYSKILRLLDSSSKLCNTLGAPLPVNRIRFPARLAERRISIDASLSVALDHRPPFRSAQEGGPLVLRVRESKPGHPHFFRPAPLRRG